MANQNTEPEFIEIITGGPTKYYRRKKIRNPKYRRPAKIAEPVSKYPATAYSRLFIAFRNARIARGTTQAHLAHELRTYQSVISKFELGKMNPSLHFLTRIAKLLGKKVYIELK